MSYSIQLHQQTSVQKYILPELLKLFVYIQPYKGFTGISPNYQNKNMTHKQTQSSIDQNLKGLVEVCEIPRSE